MDISNTTTIDTCLLLASIASVFFVHRGTFLGIVFIFCFVYLVKNSLTTALMYISCVASHEFSFRIQNTMFVMNEVILNLSCLS